MNTVGGIKKIKVGFSMEKSRIIASIPTKAKNCVLKNNGIFEKF